MEVEVDFRVHDHGSVWQFVPVTERAREFAENDLGLEDWQWLGHTFNIDHRPASVLVGQLQEHGFEIELG